jgi:hypothetical protein
VNLDAAVHKTLSLGERFKAQIRLESFNVANHPNLSSPAVNVQSPTTLGTITAIAGNPRQNQIAIKLLF